MNLRESQSKALTEIYWSGTVLNIYTIGLMILTPFWGAVMLADGQVLNFVVLLVLLGGMIALSLIEKPLIAYDPKTRVFYSPDGEVISLDQIAAIEMDARDVYVIPKSQTIKGWHLRQKGWVLVPRRVMTQLAKDHDWPLKDIAHPVSRYGFWFMP